MNGYIARNKLSCIYEGIFLFHTDSQASKRLTQYYDGRVDEYEIFKVLDFDPENGEINLFDKFQIDYPYLS